MSSAGGVTPLREARKASPRTVMGGTKTLCTTKGEGSPCAVSGAADSTAAVAGVLLAHGEMSYVLTAVCSKSVATPSSLRCAAVFQ